MLIEISCGLTAYTCTPSINEILCYYSVHRTKIKLTWMVQVACLYEIFNKGLSTENNILETWQLLYTMNKCIHTALAIGKFHRTVFVPESLITHHSIRLSAQCGLTLKQLFGQSIKSIIIESCCSCNKKLTEFLHQTHFCNHIVSGEHPLAIRQFAILLHSPEIIYKVHATITRKSEFATLHMKR